ncbi:Kiwa anti-phage protein KwaB-like domain-containing protein, partial [Citrobacter freundii]
RNFNNLRRIFNMDEYYRSATDSELDAFQESDVFHCENGFKLSDFDDTVIRRKVTLLNMSGVLKEHTIATLQEAASVLNHPLDIMRFEEKDKIKLPNNKRDIKLLLSFLDSDIYISAINGVKYRSNSKTRII